MRLTYLLEPELRQLGIRSSVAAEVYGLTIDTSNPELEQLKAVVAERVCHLSDADIANNPILDSYRRLVRGVGRSGKKFPPAAENLIEQIRRQKRFPTINTAVDSYNLVAAERFLAVGAHDLDQLQSPIRFRFSDGGEPIVPVGGSLKTTQRGDFVYADAARVLAWLDVKDSDQVKITRLTQNMVLVIQGTDVTERDYVNSAAREACELITRFCGGSYEVMQID